jgi:hypothetical protein
MRERKDGRGPWQVDFPHVMREAARCGHLELVKWLHERGFSSNNEDMLAGAIAHGHLEWLSGCYMKALSL